MNGRVLERERSVVLEPGVVQSLAVRLRRAGKMPLAVPHFDPGMIAAIVHPHRDSRHPRRHADRPARIHQQNGQPAARRQAGPHRFGGALNRLAPGRRVFDMHLRKQLFVEELGRGARRGCVGSQRSANIAQRRAPGLARLAQAGVRQNVVEENILGHAIMPRRLGKGPIDQRDMIKKKICGQAAQIRRRHVFHQELHPFALLLRRLFQRPGHLRAVGSRPAQRLLGRLRPPPRLRHRRGLGLGDGRQKQKGNTSQHSLAKTVPAAGSRIAANEVHWRKIP